MTSPITSRTNAEPLSLALLRKHVPAVKEGQTAISLLNDGSVRDREEIERLTVIKLAGSKAQEALIISALPLIKNISSKEFQRRKAWSSRISYDDVLQEAIAGFIRGLLSYDETVDHNSPTNYLGMWITTSIRRKVEAMEHDFIIPYEVVERARRIRAVRGRLGNELSRDPSDDEVLDALNNPDTANKQQKWGSNGVNNPTVRAGGRKFTQKHLDEAYDLNARSYGLQSYDTPTIESDESYEKVSTPLTLEEDTDNVGLDAEDLSNSRLKFFDTAFTAMLIGDKQRDIILRYFGMGAYTEPQSQKDISVTAILPPRFVKAVITTFSTYMPMKGGVFHYLILTTESQLIEGLELDWLIPILGDWPTGLKKPHPAPLLLTQSGTKLTKK